MTLSASQKTHITNHFVATLKARLNDYADCLTVQGQDASLRVPYSKVPELKSFENKQEEREVLKKELCQEIEFLSGLQGNRRLSAYVAYVGRRLDLGKDQVATDAQLRPLIEDFIQSCRPVVCKIK